MRQKTPDMPNVTFDPFIAYAAALIGLIPKDEPGLENIRQFQQFFSVPSLKEGLEVIDGSLLLADYERAGHMIPTFIPLIVGAFNEFLFPFAKQLQEKRGQDTMTFPPDLDMQRLQEHIWIEGERVITSNPGLGRFRLYMTIFLAAFPASDEQTREQWATMLENIVSGVLGYFGFSSKLFANLLTTPESHPPD